MSLSAENSQVLVIDLQERLVAALRGREALVRRAQFLTEAALLLDVPITVSEQYREGLGPTVEPIASRLAAATADIATLPKMAFSCLRDDGISARLQALRGEGRGTLIVCGAEAHVCVLQTALDAARAGFHVVIAQDATASRNALDHDAAMARLVQAGIVPATTEMIAFEWLESAAHPRFRALSALVKAAAAESAAQP